MTPTLRPRQIELLGAIARAWEAPRPLPPTLRELLEDTSFASTSSIAYQLDYLYAKGWITREPDRARAIWLTPLGVTWSCDRGFLPVFPTIHSPTERE